MDSLNLRTSSVKTGANIRKISDMRTSMIKLPIKYENSSEDFVIEFLNAATACQQLEAIKSICEGSSQTSINYQFLTDLYFAIPLQHPVRNYIGKFLSKSTENKSMVELTLQKSIHELITSVMNESAASNWNIVIASLSSCFDNFPQGKCALKHQLSLALHFLNSSLIKYKNELPVQLSSSSKNELYLYLHNSFRLIISFVQHYSEEAYSTSGDICKEIKLIAHDIMKDPDVPMDTKRNAGILTAYLIQWDKNSLEDFISIRASETIEEDNVALEINLCAGLVNTITVQLLYQYIESVEKIIRKIFKIINLHSTDASILLLGTRCFLHATKNLFTSEFQKTTKGHMKKILATLMDFCLLYLENYMDTVRHLCRDLLRNIFRLEKKFGFEDLLQEILKDCNASSVSISLQSIILSVAGEVLGTDFVLLHNPNIFSKLFEPYLLMDLNVSICFESLMVKHRTETNFDTWSNRWIKFLLTNRSKDMEKNSSYMENLIKKAIKCEPKVVDLIIGENDSNEFFGRSLPLRIRLAVLWTARKNGYKAEEFQTILKTFSNHLRIAILSHCDDTRIMALRLLVESHKSTELLSFLECELILLYLRFNSNCQSPSTREKGLALVSKALYRLELNLIRGLKDQEMDYFYFQFLIIAHILVENLFPSANFSRRSISLQLLQQCIDIMIRNKLTLSNNLPKKTSEVLFKMLNDSYPSNKHLALSMLKTIEEYNRVKSTNQLPLSIIKNLMVSVKPNDSLTAAYYLQYYCFQKEIFINDKEDSQETIYYFAINWCMEILLQGLETAIQSIILAAKSNPLYGGLFAIRHLMQKVDFYRVANKDKWRTLMRHLINICINLANVVGPVVNSSSPEGHLPNDFTEIPEGMNTEKEDPNAPCMKVLSNKPTTNPDNSRSTSQMVLLCAWRTVKEVSLILGDLALKLPIESKQNPSAYLVTIDQIEQIGSHFLELLSETKHRGAFEQAFVGFSKLCSRLWCLEQPELHQLPMKWLNELMEIILNDEKMNEKICATRRSAGVPFMVQALITSELQIGSKKALNCFMRHFIPLLLNKEKTSEARTHALNILRNLFRCTDLSESVMDYVADGVKCCIRSYDAETWPERNSATLLFSALMIRIFGVQRTKDSAKLNIRNKMTGRIFFFRYPRLYDFFLDELKNASENIENKNQTAKLYALLLILGRLYPSSLEGIESNLKLSNFIPLMSECTKSPEMHTRVLAAKAIVPFIPPDEVELYILNKVEIVNDMLLEKYNSNHLHGLILQVLYLIKAQEMNNTKASVGDEFRSLLCEKLISVTQITCINVIVLTTILEICLEIMKRLLTYSDILLENLNLLAVQFRKIPKTCCSISPKFKKISSLFIFYIQKLTGEPSDIIETIISHLKHEPKRENYEEIKTCLNVLLLLLIKNKAHFEDIEDFETVTIENGFVESLEETYKNSLCNELRNSHQMFKALKAISNSGAKSLHYPNCITKAYALISQMKATFLIETFNLIELIQTANNSHEQLKTSIAMCVFAIVNAKACEEGETEAFLNFLQEISQPWHCFSLRLLAANLLQHLYSQFVTAISQHNLEFTCCYVTVTLRLLNDDDAEVRTNISRLISQHMNESQRLKISREHLPNDFIVVPSFAQRSFFFIFQDILNIPYNKEDNEFFEKVVLHIIKIFGISEETEIHANVEDYEVFDKNEANVFAEPRKVLLDLNVALIYCRQHKMRKVIENLN